MDLIDLKSEADFNLFEKNEGLSVVHFMADWAPQCAQMNDVLKELQKQDDLKDIKFGKLCAEDIPEISLRFQITAVPTFIILLNGKLIERIDGADAADLTTKIKKQAAKYSLTSANNVCVDQKEDLNTKLKRLINASKCMVFMKGSPDSPRCGFSKTLMELLKKHNAEFGHFDILSDEEVRQGLKTYSDWPTYPQLYVDGELIGGLDILKEMDASNDLGDVLPKRSNLEDKLKTLIHKAPLMVFMKGDPEEPRCGFSKQLMAILKETKLSFKTFDILTDEDVRQGLKKFSNWPTYPQVYVKGELVGGLDIIKEMKEDGSLLDALKAE